MTDIKAKVFTGDGTPVTWCIFCGAKVGQKSDRTGKIATAMYWCEPCVRNYCDQCSYAKEIAGAPVQHCLRCDAPLESLM